VLRLQTAVSCAVACALLALPAPAFASPSGKPHPSSLVAAHSQGSSATASSGQSTSSEAPVPVAASDTPPAGRRLSANAVLEIADALPKMRAVRAEYPGSYGGAYLKGPFRWQVSYFSRNGKQEIGQVTIAETSTSAKVVEQWTGFQVAWSMARGIPGAFGEHVNALYIWLPLCLLFLLPFFDFRRPFSLLHLDLLVLLSFSISLAFFNHAHIYASVPLAYPPLVYLLARMLALTRRERTRREQRPLHLLVPAPWLLLGVVFLVGFRIALNVTDSNVIDVGYAGVIGAERIVDGRPLYGSYPSDNEHGDTYGAANYEAYIPFQQVFGWKGRWDDLPAAHAAAITFDLLAAALIFLLGRRVRGPALGIALAYAWVAYPFTLFTLESNANDSLVAVLVLAALLAASYQSSIARSARGAFSALAALSKFAPLALAPLFATHGLRELPPARRPRALAVFVVAFLLTAALASIPALAHDSLHTIYERTIAYQASRGSPFSVWGLYGGLANVQQAVQIAAIALALALAVLPRRPDLIGLAAACAAVLVATQLGIDHWFYLYIPWFFPLVMIALLGRFSDPRSPPAVVASEPARWSQPAVAASSG
jgi:hypothetical protein